MLLFYDKIIDVIKKFLVARQETIAVAESVTSGLLQVALSTAKDASHFFHGGVTTYNLGQKCRHLSVNSIHAENCNSVSQKVAEEMALGVCDLFGSDFGIAITGFATPVKESGNKLYAYWAAAYQGKIILSEEIEAPKISDQLKVQIFYAKRILKDFAVAIKENEF